MSTPQWSIECDYMESCNCDFGCTCNFSGLPSFGSCEALVGYHIRKGHYGELQLDNLDFIYAASWPRAIHQGDGTLRVYITDRASEAQRKAIADIASTSSSPIAGVPASSSVTPARASARAIATFSSMEKATPGACSPSRNVVSLSTTGPRGPRSDPAGARLAGGKRIRSLPHSAPATRRAGRTAAGASSRRVGIGEGEAGSAGPVDKGDG